MKQNASKSSTVTRYGKTILILAVGLSACNTASRTPPVENTASNSQTELPLFQPQNDANQDPRAYCPKTVMRAGTETLNIYPDGLREDDPERPSKLRFRATITDVVRECNYAGQFLNMKVGVAGRTLSGPSGETGTFTMPIRIAVTRGDEVLYSQLHDVATEIPLGRTNSKFSYVDSAITIPKPENENIIVYVGYDEQRVDNPQQKKRKPVN